MKQKIKQREIKLGVNIDHIATLRQARAGNFPDVLKAALTAESAGADGITAHLREDRRHIQDRDILLLKNKIKTKLNLEMAATEAMVSFACQVRPSDVCLVPERRQELTTEGGLNAIALKKDLEKKVQRLKKAGISVSIFIDPNVRQIQAAYRLGASAVELHTGTYANADSRARQKELQKLKVAAECARWYGLVLNAGHGLDYENVSAIVKIPEMNELNIGFSIISESVFVGLYQAVQKMKLLCRI